jgi:hypothetical protein
VTVVLQVEGEISMLRQVLGSKVRRATELKRNLGITPFKEFQTDLKHGIDQIKGSQTLVLYCLQHNKTRI